MNATATRFWKELEHEIRKHPVFRSVKFLPRSSEDVTRIHVRYWSEEHGRGLNVFTDVDNELFESIDHSIPVKPFVKMITDEANWSLREGLPVIDN